MLFLQSIDSYLGGSQIIHNVSTTFPERQITAVLGRNGTGKTTLLKTIMGLSDRMTGNLRLRDTDLSLAPAHMRARSGLAYVPQGRDIISDFTVRENILMGCFASRSGVRAIPRLVPKLFPYLMANLDRAGGLLSGGQQQQLAIARALAADPDILLLDEPTEGIQPNIVEEIEHIIVMLNAEIGLTIILVEQNVTFARRAAHGFVMMQKGQSVASGKVGELTNDMLHRYISV
jgi:urea transport system ATP-binding protein